MCTDLMDLDHLASDFGWSGWSEGADDADMVVYQCGCPDEHTSYVAQKADDIDYYKERAEFIRRCRT